MDLFPSSLLNTATKECSLNHIQDPYMIYGTFLNSGFFERCGYLHWMALLSQMTMGGWDNVPKDKHGPQIEQLHCYSEATLQEDGISLSGIWTWFQLPPKLEDFSRIHVGT